MRKTRIAVLAVVLLCTLISAGVVSASMFSDNYVPWDARWGGGGRSSSDNYAIDGTVGQGAIGWTGSDDYGVGAGYWYHVGGEYEVYLPLVVRAFAP